MKSISLTAPREHDDAVEFETFPGEFLYGIFNKPGVRTFTTHQGVRIERNMENN